MALRKRFKVSRVCSSDNYKESKKLHKEYIQNFHNTHIIEIESISSSIVIKPKYYISCFGKLMEITEVEAIRLKESVKIIIK